MLANRMIAGSTLGAVSFTTPGTYSWVAPAGVTSVCAVCIGAGADASDINGYGASGGALAYKNNIAVTPGASYTVFVASGGSSSRSYFIDTATVSAGIGSNRTGDGGGNGGQGGLGGSGNPCGGGGGAGGYSGDCGGGGSYTYPGNDGLAGSGGGAGGGAWGGSGKGGCGGGGVGLLGTGSSGGTSTGGGNAGSGGSSGSVSSGVDGAAGGGYGGGGGGMTTGGSGGNGASGAVRLVWGPGKSYPSNAI